MADTKQSTNAATATTTNPDKAPPKNKKGDSRSKKRQKKRQLPVADRLQEDVCKVLQNCGEGDELKALVYALQPESDFVGCVFEKILHDINRVLSMRYRNFEIHPFGSSVCGLAFKNSDFDIYVDIKDLPDKTKKTISKVIYQTVDTMRRLNLFDNIVAIVNAKIPLLKCIHSTTGFSCDFSFSSPLGRYNSQIVREIIRVDHRIHPLILILKHWMKTRNLLGTGKITSYCLIMMIIHFLQQIKIVKPLAVYQAQVPKFIVDAYWNLAWNTSVPINLNNSPNLTISSLLRGFVDYYKDFDFPTKIICPLYGQTYDRAEFSQKPPAEFGAYIEYMKSEGAAPLNLNHPMCVQDPFALNHNVAASGAVYRYFIAELRNASEMFRTQFTPNVLSAEFLLKFFTEFAAEPPKSETIISKTDLQVRLMPLEFELSVIRRTMMGVKGKSQPIEPDQVKKRWAALTVSLIRFVIEHLLKLQIVAGDGDNERLKKHPKLNGQKDVSDAKTTINWTVTGTEDVCHMKKLIKATSPTYFVDEVKYAASKFKQLTEKKRNSLELNCLVTIHATPVDVHVMFNENGQGKKNATKCFYQNFTRSIRNHMKAYFLLCERGSFVEPDSLWDMCEQEMKSNTAASVTAAPANTDTEITPVVADTKDVSTDAKQN